SLALKQRIIDAVSDEVWAEQRVDPPELAKSLRNTPSDTPSMGHPQIENESSAATCHLPPSTGRRPPSSSSPPQHDYDGAVDNAGEIETTIEQLSERFRA